MVDKYDNEEVDHPFFQGEGWIGFINIYRKIECIEHKMPEKLRTLSRNYNQNLRELFTIAR